MRAFIIFCSLNIEFNFTTGSFLSEVRLPEIRIFYKIPRNELAFIKFDYGFIASFRISCSLLRNGKEIGDTWIVKDTVKEYEATLRKELIEGIVKVQASPGDYKLKIEVRDLNSQRVGVKSSKVRLKEIRGDYPQGGSSFRFYEKEEKVGLFFEVYNFDELPFKLFYELGTIKDSIEFETKKFVNPVRLEFPADSLGFGLHKITVRVGGVKFEGTLYIREPFWSKDYEERVKELIYIAEPWEIDTLLAIPMEKREEYWNKFWARKDSVFGIPAAELQERYFKRVDYANEHFSGLREGWRTDRGMVYIKLGKPDETVSHPFEIDRQPYEVWYYYARNLKFVFVDKLGFGDYELEYPKYWREEIQF